MKPVRVDAEASDEIREAAVWYEERRPGLGADFLDAVAHAMEQLSAQPSAAVRCAGAAEDLPVMRVLVPRFRYSLVFVELESELRVLAVAHPKRRPFYWRDRVQR